MKLIAQATVFVSAILIAGIISINQTNAAQITAVEPAPGQPSTYTEKYQCPFVENVEAKGCNVPNDITCNADWTECHPKEAVVITPVEPTPAPVHKPVSGCNE